MAEVAPLAKEWWTRPARETWHKLIPIDAWEIVEQENSLDVRTVGFVLSEAEAWEIVNAHNMIMVIQDA
jgi:hypothetical protein